MKTLTLQQPWATLLFHGKDIENRTWKTNYRGKILIHTSSKTIVSLYKCFKKGLFTEEQLRFLYEKNILDKYNPDFVFDEFPVSSIIGTVNLVDCVINHSSIWAEKSISYFNDLEESYYNKPIYNWVLKDPILFHKPIRNVKGKLSLWEFQM